MRGKYVITGLLIAAITVTLAGCDIFGAGVSASDRMSDFAADVNAVNYGSLWEHTDGGMTNQAKDSGFWMTYFSSKPFTYSMSGDSATASCNGYSFGFTLEATDTEGLFGSAKIYMITKITREGTVIFQ